MAFVAQRLGIREIGDDDPTRFVGCRKRVTNHAFRIRHGRCDCRADFCARSGVSMRFRDSAGTALAASGGFGGEETFRLADGSVAWATTRGPATSNSTRIGRTNRAIAHTFPNRVAKGFWNGQSRRRESYRSPPIAARCVLNRDPAAAFSRLGTCVASRRTWNCFAHGTPCDAERLSRPFRAFWILLGHDKSQGCGGLRPGL